MSLVVAMPAVSPTMTHGSLVTQLKQPGDAVAVGDVIAEIESDKAIVELESDVNGVIERWLVAQGTEEIPVGTALVQLVAADSAATPAPTAQPLESSQGALPKGPHNARAGSTTSSSSVEQRYGPPHGTVGACRHVREACERGEQTRRITRDVKEPRGYVHRACPGMTTRSSPGRRP